MLERTGLDDVIPVFYECACVEESWEPALQAIQTALNGSGACLRVRRSGLGGRDFLTSVGNTSTPESVREWEMRPCRSQLDASCRTGEVRVRRWEQELPGEAIVEELRSHGVAETMFHCFASDDQSTYTLAIMRDEDAPSFGKEDIENVRLLGRHFAEAIRLRQKHVAGGLNGRYQAEALDQLSIAGMIVDRFGSVLPLNAAASDLLEDGDCLQVSRNSLVAAFRSCNSELQSLLKRVFEHEGDEPLTYAMAVERKSGRRPLGIVVYSTKAMCPISNRMENCALIFARDPDTAFTTDPHLLQKLFSFTPAEANLAIGLAKGRPLKEIECSLNIRHNTARAHLRAMFLKAEVTRQAELVSLLTNSVAPLGSRQGFGNNEIPSAANAA